MPFKRAVWLQPDVIAERVTQYGVSMPFKRAVWLQHPWRALALAKVGFNAL